MCTVLTTVVVAGVVFREDLATQAKVRHLAHEPGRQQDVAGSQVTVDKVMVPQVCHPIRNLTTELVLHIQGERHVSLRLLLQYPAEDTVLAVGEYLVCHGQHHASQSQYQVRHSRHQASEAVATTATTSAPTTSQPPPRAHAVTTTATASTMYRHSHHQARHS